MSNINVQDAMHELRRCNISPSQSHDVHNGVRSLVDLCHGLSARSGWWNRKAPAVPEEIRAEVTELLKAKGFPVGLPMTLEERLATVPEKLCLTHSEVSEAMEGHRRKQMDDKLKHRLMLEVELADAVIRIADLAGALDLDLAGAIIEKLAFNQRRPDHKPEARAAEGGKAY